MIFPPIFLVCSNYAPLAALLNDETGALKLYPFNLAPKDVTYPYATWQNIAGGPQNNVSDRPDADKAVLQVNVWASTAASLMAVVSSMADAIEGESYITSWGNQERDAETLAFGYSFDVDWFTHR